MSILGQRRDCLARMRRKPDGHFDEARQPAWRMKAIILNNHTQIKMKKRISVNKESLKENKEERGKGEKYTQ